MNQTVLGAHDPLPHSIFFPPRASVPSVAACRSVAPHWGHTACGAIRHAVALMLWRSWWRGPTRRRSMSAVLEHDSMHMVHMNAVGSGVAPWRRVKQ